MCWTTSAANGHVPSHMTKKNATENLEKLTLQTNSLTLTTSVSLLQSQNLCFFLRLASFWPPSHAETKELCNPVRVVLGFWVTSDLSASAILSVNANKVVPRTLYGTSQGHPKKSGCISSQMGMVLKKSKTWLLTQKCCSNSCLFNWF